MLPSRPHTLGLSPADIAVAELEGQVVADVLAGDTAAYRTLVTRHHRRLFAIIYRLTGNLTDAEDLAQQALVSAYVALASYDPKFPFRAWVNRIAVNLAKDHLKSRKRSEVSLDEDPESGAACYAGTLPDPERATGEGERRAFLERGLAELPWKDREVLVLKDIEDHSYEEMRVILGRPITALKIRVVRARRRLRDLLVRWGVDGG